MFPARERERERENDLNIFMAHHVSGEMMDLLL